MTKKETKRPPKHPGSPNRPRMVGMLGILAWALLTITLAPRKEGQTHSDLARGGTGGKSAVGAQSRPTGLHLEKGGKNLASLAPRRGKGWSASEAAAGELLREPQIVLWGEIPTYVGAILVAHATTAAERRNIQKGTSSWREMVLPIKLSWAALRHSSPPSFSLSLVHTHACTHTRRHARTHARVLFVPLEHRRNR